MQEESNDALHANDEVYWPPYDWPLRTAARLQQWDTCLELLISNSICISPLDESEALLAAAEAPPSQQQLQLIDALISGDHHAWDAWLGYEWPILYDATPLEVAARAGNYDVCELLCTKITAEVIGRGALQSALRTASEGGHLSIAQFLSHCLSAMEGEQKRSINPHLQSANKDSDS
jgi:hypothetical protein